MVMFLLKVPEGKLKTLRDKGYADKDLILGVRPEDVHDELLFIQSSPDTKLQSNRCIRVNGAETMLYSKLGGQDFV